MATLMICGNEVLVDEDTYMQIKDYTLYITENNYVYYWKTSEQMVYLHRFVAGVSEKRKVVDHIDGNRFNNRKENLRICSQAENLCNRTKFATRNGVCCNSQFKGVTAVKRKGEIIAWKAQISKNSEMYYIGTYKSEIEAALSYNKVALELHGEFAKLNEM